MAEQRTVASDQIKLVKSNREALAFSVNPGRDIFSFGFKLK